VRPCLKNKTQTSNNKTPQTNKNQKQNNNETLQKLDLVACICTLSTQETETEDHKVKASLDYIATPCFKQTNKNVKKKKKNTLATGVLTQTQTDHRCTQTDVDPFSRWSMERPGTASDPRLVFWLEQPLSLTLGGCTQIYVRSVQWCKKECNEKGAREVVSLWLLDLALGPIPPALRLGDEQDLGLIEGRKEGQL
jgi:hypothetical protein